MLGSDHITLQDSNNTCARSSWLSSQFMNAHTSVTQPSNNQSNLCTGNVSIC